MTRFNWPRRAAGLKENSMPCRVARAMFLVTTGSEPSIPLKGRGRGKLLRALFRGNEKLFSWSVHRPGCSNHGRHMRSGTTVGRRCCLRFRLRRHADTQSFADLRLDLRSDVLILLEELLRILAA